MSLFKESKIDKIKGLFGNKSESLIFRKSINESTSLIKENIVQKYLLNDFKRNLELFNKDLSEIQIRIFKNDTEPLPIVNVDNLITIDKHLFDYKYTITSNLINEDENIMKYTLKIKVTNFDINDSLIEHNKYFSYDENKWLLDKEEKILNYISFKKYYDIPFVSLLINLAIYSYFMTHKIIPYFNINLQKHINKITTINEYNQDRVIINSKNISFNEFISQEIIKNIYNNKPYYNSQEYGSLICSLNENTYGYIKHIGICNTFTEKIINTPDDTTNEIYLHNVDEKYIPKYYNLLGIPSHNLFIAIDDMGFISFIKKIPNRGNGEVFNFIRDNDFMFNKYIIRAISCFNNSNISVLVSDRKITLLNIIDIKYTGFYYKNIKNTIDLPSKDWTVIKAGISSNDEYIGILYYDNNNIDILNLYILNLKNKKELYYNNIKNFAWLPKTPNELIIQYSDGINKKINIINNNIKIISLPPINRRNSPKKVLLTNLCVSYDEKYIAFIYEKNGICIYSLTTSKMHIHKFTLRSLLSISFLKHKERTIMHMSSANVIAEYVLPETI